MSLRPNKADAATPPPTKYSIKGFDGGGGGGGGGVEPKEKWKVENVTTQCQIIPAPAT